MSVSEGIHNHRKINTAFTVTVQLSHTSTTAAYMFTVGLHRSSFSVTLSLNGRQYEVNINIILESTFAKVLSWEKRATHPFIIRVKRTM